ncbi:MAG TPA: cytochrome c oxidase assembly protein [Gemmatimonadales bacterium]
MGNLRWWCGPGSGAWDWTWQPYAGVWLFVALLTVAYARHLRSLPRIAGTDRRATRAQIGYFAGGVFCLWAALDWPLGPLGAGYLASIHMVQFLLTGVTAPALLLLALPAATFARLDNSRRTFAVLDALVHPLPAFFLFNIVMTVTHWPTVVDVVMGTPAGSFAVDMIWLTTGLVFWWPVICPVPSRTNFGTMHKVIYLVLNAVVIRPPFVLLLFSQFPAYRKFELAAPIPGTDALADQQFAGGLMKIGTAWLMGVGIAALIYRYHRAQSPAGVAVETPRRDAT